MATKSELGLLPNTQDEVLEGNVLELGQGPDFDEQNSQIFEVNHPFVNQSADEVIGRMDWLLSNSKAEFLLTLRELGLSSRQIVGVYGAFEEITDDFEDFVSAGLEGHEGPDSEVDDTELLRSIR